MKLQTALIALFLSLPLVFSLQSPQAKEYMRSESYVRPIDLDSLGERLRALPKRDQSLIRLYFEGAQRYVLTVGDGAPPDGGTSGTEHWRNISERAHGAAVLSSLPNGWPEELNVRCREQSAAFVREFVTQFRETPFMGRPLKTTGYTGGGVASWWASEMGTAAWFLWDRLEPDLRKGVADMIVFHADYVAGQKPLAQVKYDTQAESVAWDSSILSLATNMMPKHPHAARWREAAKHYMYTIFATSKDVEDATPGDDGTPIKDWVAGANIHDDFALENHGRFHIDYVFACYRFFNYGAAMHRLAGNPVPQAYTHHTKDLYENIVLPCTNGSGFTVYVSDNDWKRYHAWSESPAVHGYNAIMESSRLSSALEERALRNAVSYWREFPPKFSYDNPYCCGKAWTPRIADIVLLHLFSPPLPEPIPAGKVDAELQGVTQKQNVNLVSQYSKDGSFRSFFWGPGPTVRAIEPKDDGWMMLPLWTNYTLALDGNLALNWLPAQILSQKGEDWFWTLRQTARGKEAFVSLPNETVVMMTSATLSVAVAPNPKRADIAVAIEKAHKEFAVYYRGGKATIRPGQKEWVRTDKADGLELETPWVNLANSIGYITINLSGDSFRMALPKPNARDALSLHRIDNPRNNPRFAIVALPNHNRHQTAATARNVAADCSDGMITCLVPPYFVCANFTSQRASAHPPRGTAAAAPVTCPPNSVVILHMADGNAAWSLLK